MQYKYTDPVKGELYEPVVVAPPVVGNLTNQVFIFTGNTAQPVTVKMQAMADGVKGDISLKLPAGFVSKPASILRVCAERG